MSRGLDLMMSMDVNSDWLRTSNNEARRKTDYEKYLEQEITKQKDLIRELTERKSFIKKFKELFK